MELQDLSHVLTDIFTTMEYHFVYGAFYLKPYAIGLMATLATIDMAITHLFNLKEQDHFQALIKNLLKYGFFLWLILIYPDLMSMILDSFVKIGWVAGGAGGDLPPSKLADPAYIMELGYSIMDSIYKVVGTGAATGGNLSTVSTNTDAVGSAMNMIFSGSATDGAGKIVHEFFTTTSMVMYLAFLIMAAQVFITYLEFYIIGVLGIMLLPFAVLEKTSFIGRKAIDAIVHIGIKIMSLVFILCVCIPIIETLVSDLGSKLAAAQKAGQMVSNLDCLRLLTGVLGMTFLCWQAPTLVSSLLSGHSAMDANNLSRQLSGGGGSAGGAGGANNSLTGAGGGGHASLDSVKSATGTTSLYAGMMGLGAKRAEGQHSAAIAKQTAKSDNGGSTGGAAHLPPITKPDTGTPSGGAPAPTGGTPGAPTGGNGGQGSGTGIAGGDSASAQNPPSNNLSPTAASQGNDNQGSATGMNAGEMGQRLNTNSSSGGMDSSSTAGQKPISSAPQQNNMPTGNIKPSK